MKKSLLPLACLLLLLAACGEDAGQPTSSPSGTLPQPSSSVSAAPLPTEASSGPVGLVWGKTFGMEDVDLAELPTAPAAPGDLWISRTALVGTVPEENISLYLLNLDTPGVLVRKGDALTCCPLDHRFQDLPLLVWQDFDGDGAGELAVRYLMAEDELSAKYGLSDGGVRPRFELHIYEWDGAAWTDHPFASSPQAVQAMFSGNLDYRYDGGEFTLSAGRTDTPDGVRWLTTVTGWLPEGDVDVEGPVVLGGQVFFRLEESGITAVFTVSLPAGDGGAGADIATLTVPLRYDGGSFSPNGIHLEAVDWV